MFSLADLDRVLKVDPRPSFFLAALRCLKFAVRGAPPVNKTLTIKSVRAYRYEYSV